MKSHCFICQHFSDLECKECPYEFDEEFVTICPNCLNKIFNNKNICSHCGTKWINIEEEEKMLNCYEINLNNENEFNILCPNCHFNFEGKNINECPRCGTVWTNNKNNKLKEKHEEEYLNKVKKYSSKIRNLNINEDVEVIFNENFVSEETEFNNLLSQNNLTFKDIIENFQKPKSIGNVEAWNEFSKEMNDYIENFTMKKYSNKKSFELIDVATNDFILLSIIKYALRVLNDEGKGGEAKKIAHYASFLWHKNKNETFEHKKI